MSILLKNNFERIKYHKAILLIACVIMPIFICAAVYISNHSTSKEIIAVLEGSVSADISCEQYAFTNVKEEPPLSAFVDGTYAAYAKREEDGTYSITTLKSQHDKQAIQILLTTGQLPTNYKGEDIKRSERGVGTNILGFVTMLILMQSTVYKGLHRVGI